MCVYVGGISMSFFHRVVRLKKTHHTHMLHRPSPFSLPPPSPEASICMYVCRRSEVVIDHSLFMFADIPILTPLKLRATKRAHTKLSKHFVYNSIFGRFLCVFRVRISSFFSFSRIRRQLYVGLEGPLRFFGFDPAPSGFCSVHTYVCVHHN